MANQKKPDNNSKGSQKERYIRASDARPWTECLRKAWYNHYPPPQEKLVEDDSMLEFFREKGFTHEDQILQELQKKYTVTKASSPSHTQQLMKKGVDVIYQPQFLDHQKKIVGHPDFLLRMKDGSYQVADAKLANSVKKDIKIQMGVYRLLTGSRHPAIIYLGNGNTDEVGSEADKITQEFLQSMRDILNRKTPPSAKHAFNKCSGCRFQNVCVPEFIANDDISLLYGINQRAAEALEGAGIKTIAQLADTDPQKIPDLPYLKQDRDKERAVLAAKAWKREQAIQVSRMKLPRGTWVHFDIESNPHTSENKDHVYLWGLLKPDYKEGDFSYVWAESEKDDRKAWFAFLRKVKQLGKDHPNLVLAHYSQYEVQAIKRYAERYKMKNHPTVKWLLGKKSPLFDMLEAVRQSFVMPTRSYGLKEICKHKNLVNFQWSDEDSGSAWSIVQYHKYMNETDPQKKEELKQKIIEYNRDDVIATRKLEEWGRAQNIKFSAAKPKRNSRPSGPKP